MTLPKTTTINGRTVRVHGGYRHPNGQLVLIHGSVKQ